MKKGKFLEVLRIAVMCIVLDKKGSMSPCELGSFLGCKKTLVVEYARAHQNLFEISNNSISSKRISLQKVWIPTEISGFNLQRTGKAFSLERLCTRTSI